jgi:MFS family permease
VFCDQILQAGPAALGILRAMPAIGAIAAGFIITLIPLNNNTGKKLLLSTLGFGLCILGFALSTEFYWSCFMLAFSGAFDMVSVVIRHTILQTFAPEEMRGRLSAINYIFIGTSNEIGAFESGIAAGFFGLVPSILIGGSITIFITLMLGVFSKPIRDLSFKTEVPIGT